MPRCRSSTSLSDPPAQQPQPRAPQSPATARHRRPQPRLLLRRESRVDPALIERLVSHARASSPNPKPRRCRSPVGGGRAWRGYFPLGGELTSTAPTGKKACTSAASSDPSIRVCAPAPSCTAPNCGRDRWLFRRTPCSPTSMRSRGGPCTEGGFAWHGACPSVGSLTQAAPPTR